MVWRRAPFEIPAMLPMLRARAVSNHEGGPCVSASFSRGLARSATADCAMLPAAEKANRRNTESTIRSNVAALQKKMGMFSLEQKRSLAAVWVEMRQNLIAEQKSTGVKALREPQ